MHQKNPTIFVQVLWRFGDEAVYKLSSRWSSSPSPSYPCFFIWVRWQIWSVKKNETETLISFHWLKKVTLSYVHLICNPVKFCIQLGTTYCERIYVCGYNLSCLLCCKDSKYAAACTHVQDNVVFVNVEVLCKKKRIFCWLVNIL